MDDSDAPGGTWDHWIVYDIPAGTGSLVKLQVLQAVPIFLQEPSMP